MNRGLIQAGLPFSLVFWAMLAGAEPQALSPDTTADWSRTLQDASRTQEYSGVLTVSEGNRQVAYQLWHTVSTEDDAEYEERMRVLDGPLMELVRTPERVTCLHAPGTEVPADHDVPQSPFASLMLMDPERLAANYQLWALGDERLASRAARVYELRSQHGEPRLVHRVWVDEETGIALRHRRLAPNGDVLADVRYVTFRPDATDVPPGFRTTFAEPFWHQFEQAEPTQGGGADEVWQLAPAPAGFVRLIDEYRNGEWYQLWSDGMVEFSLMVEPVNGEPPEPVMERQGSTLLMTAIHGDWIVALVGDVPDVLARDVLTRVQWQ